MKIIGVISDTHMPRMARELPQKLIEGLKGVDLILHAGDINSDSVIYELEAIAPVHAVAGNTDDWSMAAELGTRKILEVEGCKIGVIHGDGSSGTALDRAIKAFKGNKTDCIVFGHSHIPFNEVIDGILCFNPGSPTDKRRQERYSYGLLRVTGSGISGEIKFFDKAK